MSRAANMDCRIRLLHCKAVQRWYVPCLCTKRTILVLAKMIHTMALNSWGFHPIVLLLPFPRLTSCQKGTNNTLKSPILSSLAKIVTPMRKMTMEQQHRGLPVSVSLTNMCAQHLSMRGLPQGSRGAQALWNSSAFEVSRKRSINRPRTSLRLLKTLIGVVNTRFSGS